MKLALRLITLAFAGAVMLATAGCGSSPSSGNSTILGTVTNAPALPLRVTVEGTNLSTSTNSVGEFTLEGVPSGTVVLHFAGSGVDVRIEISGISAGQTLRITVRITTSGAVIVRAPNEIEFTGTIESITAPNLKVSGLTVITNADTEFKRRSERLHLADLAVGQLIRVEGSLNADGKVVAREIRVLVPADQNRVRIRGVIESISPPNLKISGLPIATDANTRFNVHSLANLSVGDVVQVNGTLRADGTVLARSIEKIVHEEEEEEVELKGAIQSVTPPTLTVAGTTISTNSSTRIKRRDRAVPISSLQVGERVEVQGRRLADGSILASRIEVEND